MKLFNKQILEAIQKGINLAIDDFDDELNVDILKTGEIKNIANTREFLKFKLLTDRLDNDLMSIHIPEIVELTALYNKFGFQYTVKSDDGLLDLIDYINDNLKFYKANLNWIDTSNIEDMSYLFEYKKFNGDISKWDVSNVKDMSHMFADSLFTGDISNWNVSNVVKMKVMFTRSIFNGDISRWNVGRVKNMSCMFRSSKFNKDISNWDVSEVINMQNMFDEHAVFNLDISKWNVGKVTNMGEMFMNNTKFNQDISNWNTENVLNAACIFFNCPIKKEYKPKFENAY